MAPSTSLNAEWAGWVQEAADHAANNGSRSCDTYRRAARAIRLHNQPLHHPKQALALNGVGEGIVRLITARLQEKCDATGDPFPTEPESLKGKRKKDTTNPTRPRKRAKEILTAEERALDPSSSEEEEEQEQRPSNNRTGSSAGQKKKGKPRQPRRRRKIEVLTPEERALDPSSSDPEPSLPPKTTRQASPAQPKTRTNQKKYIPKRRTGCWGILVGLSILTTERAGSFTKQEIIEHAQKYCDSSYTERGSRGGGAGNSGHYTAWNMKKLLAEGLSLSTPGRQAKFTLTQQGFELASILAEKEDLTLVPFDKSKLPDGNSMSLLETHVDSARDPLPAASSSKAPVTSTSNASNLNPCGPNPSSSSDTIHSASHQRANTTAQKSNNPQRKNSLPTIPDDPEIACLNTNSSQQSSRVSHNRGPFEFWYLDRAGLRVRNMDDADSRMHPRTFETLYQVEFAASQSSHPVKRSSIVDEAALRPSPMNSSEGHMMGWMYESKAIPSCPGFGLSTHSPTLSTSTTIPPPTLSSSYNKNNSAPHVPSASQRRRSSPSPDPPVNIIHDDSYCGLSAQTTISAGYQNRISPLDRLFKPSSSGSATPAGSVVSIPSEADPAAPKDLAPSARLKPPSRPGSCEILWSGAALSETVAGWSASESPDSLPVSGAVNSLASSRTVVDLSREASNLSHQSSSLDRSSSSCPLRNLKRTTSALSESRSSSDGLPSNRTRVNLKRTPSGLSESLLSRASDDVQPEVWKAGSYDICLVLDHREVRAINDRDAFYNLCVEKVSALASPGQPTIRVLQRALVLGDAIWIAVHRDSQREVVLDSIVERKRLDDLCASIKDNRFEEQKARLKRSGLRDPIYLVEAYNTQSNLDSYGQMIYTSKFETMLLNDFQLEATPDWKASVEFLVRRSEVLRDLHQTIDLSIIPDATIDRTTYLFHLADLRTKDAENSARYWVTTYGAFEVLNHKTATLTVRELWARMAHCLPGMSASKVASFVDHWPTPVSFWADLLAHTSAPLSDQTKADKYPWSWIDRHPNEPLPSALSHPDHPVEMSIASISSTQTSCSAYPANCANSRIGPALSKRLWELYTLSDYASVEPSL
ncbi:Crossover junction endonuclease mus81 [Puccinia graminis f. sp. tritici]|uniref:Crossover junction endonuclease MUS81 n=2 Tax=Puccinia graminis f. sp. tritici TaxID=56615 RepID=E3K9F2_PUCGT|nr:uncharacterized protein PGTG_07324 [Puccinia graminis f. sp. tritici CRL 75-36-700-3]EFP81072.2 hypothetical protein PGTG_07324 [Puccinia graminis f. sp. tritici CRL 75-36-700-3]KAA1069017.1 Crossover junction endonuclease mus81 [Puccinia graminis f. sp. tritici]